jgi:hypothetical protein
MPSSTDIYRVLADAVARGDLTEPFTKAEMMRVYPGFSEATYRAFLWRFSGSGDVSAESQLLVRVPPNSYRLKNRR